ncbi:lectin protein kinase family protein [Melia azedarach]|uniref:Lectin protein kinase family protein n=1 Tax=Melia azedarach TaxID=155640 RepID=A0ACC1WWM4_MELAZ|nr:lectin protein kinase family protein [Melia azedarach]
MQGKKKKILENRTLAFIAVPVVMEVPVLAACIYYLWSRHAKRKEHKESSNLELTFFHLSTVIAATDNFSSTKKLGQGGFGPVYKGQLANGQEIAVKRLSQDSGRGIVEFETVLLIAKLQHRNLVRLLGCCIEDDEKMLIYEFMPNKSLDYFLFGMTL